MRSEHINQWRPYCERQNSVLWVCGNSHPVQPSFGLCLCWTYLEILSIFAICFWFRITSMAAHTYWTTLGSACLFFTTRDMISLLITTVGNRGEIKVHIHQRDQSMNIDRWIYTDVNCVNSNNRKVAVMLAVPNINQQMWTSQQNESEILKFQWNSTPSSRDVLLRNMALYLWLISIHLWSWHAMRHMKITSCDL